MRGNRSSMARVPGAGPGSQLNPRRAKAKPFARGGNARRAPVVASLPGIRPRLRAAPPPPTRVGGREQVRDSRWARKVCGARAGDTGARREDAEAVCPEARPTTGRFPGCAAQLAPGPSPAWRAGPRLLTLFLGDFGSCSPPRSDLRSLVMSPWPSLEQSQGCWQAAAIGPAQGEAQACCSRGGQGLNPTRFLKPCRAFWGPPRVTGHRLANLDQAARRSAPRSLLHQGVTEALG